MGLQWNKSGICNTQIFKNLLTTLVLKEQLDFNKV